MKRLGASGFTLIELVVVLFLLGLLSALVLPGIGRGVDTLQLRTEAARLAAFLRYGRQQAITTGRPHSVVIDPEGHRYALRARDAEAPFLSRSFSGTVAITGDPLTVTFTPQGLSSGATLEVRGAGGRAYVLTVNAITGRVRAQGQ